MPAKTRAEVTAEKMRAVQNNGTRRKWAVIVGIVAILGLMFGVFTWVYAGRASVGDAIETNAIEIVELEGVQKTHGKSIDDHESRLRIIERVLVEVARDVKWIRDDRQKGE